MKQKFVFKTIGFTYFLLLLLLPMRSFALGSSQTPQNGSMGLEATIPSAPPTIAPSIVAPSNGQSFNTMPVAVSGLCTSNLVVKVFDNNIFEGSTVCTNGSYSLKADLINGTNNLYVQDFDALNQGSPLSNSINISYISSQYTQPGAQVTVTSSYGELGANPGQLLSWPIIIGGGTPPYAISVDWGDGNSPTLQSSSLSGKIIISHVYATSGVYTISVTVTDNKGSTGFMQLVGVANGQITKSNPSTTQKSNVSTANFLPWWILLILTLALIPAFWLGGRHGRAVLIRKYNR